MSKISKIDRPRKSHLIFCRKISYIGAEGTTAAVKDAITMVLAYLITLAENRRQIANNFSPRYRTRLYPAIFFVSNVGEILVKNCVICRKMGMPIDLWSKTGMPKGLREYPYFNR
jgi:hypothetical protein